MKRCPRCSSEVSVNDKVCPRCGLPVKQMDEFEKNFSFTDETEKDDIGETIVVSKKEAKKEAKKKKKAAKKADKKAKKQAFKDAVKNNDTKFYEYATNSGIEDPDKILETDTYRERKRKKKLIASKPVFDLDENGEFNIDTKDVEIVGKETGQFISQQYEQSYSVKKSRGDYIPPKIKWWEIYKFSDLHFARRKIKKEVVKASKIKPSFIKKSKLLLLSLFLGWTGAHNFYAQNKRKGWFSVITLVLWIGILSLASHSSFFASIEISVGGCAGFLNVFVWVSDTINIITNKFRYKIQEDTFIGLMNVETRAKLGEKYIDMELYHKPLWYRFKIWCKKKKRNYEEYKRDRRQRSIDKQKRKLAEMEEQAKIDREIAEFEAKENGENVSTSAILNETRISELKSFDDTDNFGSSQNDGQEDDGTNDEAESGDADENGENNANGEVRQRKVGNLLENKYLKYGNKKSKKKKKK